MSPSVFSNIAVALLVLGVIIVIHELGHFLVAKLFKIKVETFSVGFGPRLFGFRRGETDYRISALPLGGYVKMAGETPTDTITGAPNEFMSKPKWQRFLVAAAGPLMNLVLAVGLMAGLYVYGTQVPEFMSGQARIGIVEAASPADQAGIKSGDEIVSIDGQEQPNWQDVQALVLTSVGRPLPIVVNQSGQRLNTTVTPIAKGSDDAGYVGMGPLYRIVVGGINANSPAINAGLKVGDEIIRVKDIDLRTSGKGLPEVIQTIPDETFPITIVRDGREMDLQVTPIMQDGRRMIGIQIPPPMVMIKLGLVDAVGKSVQTNIESATLIFQVLGRLFKREASMKQLDGPIGIIRVSGQALEQGVATLLTLMALISLNLGVLNILPIPILDGGVMLLLVVESLMGRDLSLRMKERIVQVSFVFLLMLTVIVLYNDVVKLLPPSQPAP